MERPSVSRIDPECFTQQRVDEPRVCAKCFDDDDLKDLIRSQVGPRGCHFCGRRDAATIPLDAIADHIKTRMEVFYGKAAEQLSYESAEGGYQGWNVDTYDLLFDTIGLGLPRDDHSRLARALVHEIGDDLWCDFDWLALEPDDSPHSSWKQFCEIVKHSRRFFSMMSAEAGKAIQTLGPRWNF
jgi:HEPN/RES N-terminal domain 1